MRHMVAVLAAVALAGAADTPRQYLDGASLPDLLRILPPPPRPGSAEDVADRTIFRQTRSLMGTARWTLATRDVTDDRFTAFGCAMGMRVNARTAPALARIFARVGSGNMIDRAKQGFGKPRPYLVDDQPICEAKTAHLAGNGDYPSGHAATGWSTALILAELMPDRATALLTRGRTYGESRYICGSHSRSAVEAGYMAGSVLVASLHAMPDFRRDMEAARREIVHLRTRAAAADPVRCAIEARSGDSVSSFMAGQ